MFISFPKLTQFSHDWTITEKIDGTNAQVIIFPADGEDTVGHLQDALAIVDGLAVFAGSRTRIITPEADNHGFAKWVQREAKDLVQALGEGRHFGEWCGLGIQRNYGLKEKVFLPSSTPIAGLEQTCQIVSASFRSLRRATWKTWVQKLCG